MLIKFRREGDLVLVYFLELRRLVVVNRTGAKIIEAYFNKNLSLAQIVSLLGKSKEKLTKSEIKNFLSSLKKEILEEQGGGFPVFSKQKPRAPISVELQIITRCNLRCAHCLQAEYGKIMPFKKVKRILETLSQAGVFEIKLTGGEALLHPDFLKIIRLCRKNNFAVDLITNATLIDKTIVDELAKLKGVAVLVSLEGVGKDNDKIRGQGVFEKVSQAIKLLRAKGIHVEISTTLSKANLDKKEEVIAFAGEMGVPCNFNLFKPFKKGHSKFVLRPEEYFQAAEKIFAFKGIDARVTSASLSASIIDGKEREECRAALVGLTVNVDGKMIPCPSLREVDFYNPEDLPDLDENFLDSWQAHPAFVEFRRRGFRNCQARSLIFNGDINGKDPYGIDAYLERVR